MSLAAVGALPGRPVARLLTSCLISSRSSSWCPLIAAIAASLLPLLESGDEVICAGDALKHGHAVLRHEMELIHLRPIKTLGDIEQGVASFENPVYEFTQAGGVPPSDKEMKGDLLRLLPGKIQLDLLWQASDAWKSFIEFRDIVVSASARMLNIQRPQRGIHQVAAEEPVINARLPADVA